MSWKNLSLHFNTTAYIRPKIVALEGTSPEVSALFEELLGRDLALRVQVTGRSMLPFLQSGDVVTIKRVPSETLCIGDLVFFKNPQGRLILHRLLRKKHHLLQTKGDAWRTWDAPVRSSEVLGKVCIVEKISPVTGKKQFLNMESPSWKMKNRLIALQHRVVIPLRSAARVCLKNIILSSFRL